ncbi:MAG: hypothetical protein MSH14_03735 [Bacteroidales bacterium]|nr:hypothetical protein [Bacteroidales bacterium]
MPEHCWRIVNEIKNKNLKKQPWSNVECFAFGGAIVRFAPLETSFHAANHTIPPPPSYEGLSRCPKDKKLLAVSRRKNPDDKMISWRGVYQIFQNDFVW